MKRTDPTSARPITLRLALLNPPAGVAWAVQLGRTELLPPVRVTPDQVSFEVPLELVSSASGEPRLRGAAVQGPAGGRFIYVNSGSRAGVVGSGWDRRAKVHLSSVPLEMLQARPASEALLLHGEITGTAKDGGPACASVPLLRGSWSFEKRIG
jgi:hypothetical protein